MAEKSLFTVDGKSATLQVTDTIGRAVEAARSDIPDRSFRALGRTLADVAVAFGHTAPKAAVTEWLGHESVQPPVSPDELRWALEPASAVSTDAVQRMINWGGDQ